MTQNHILLIKKWIEKKGFRFTKQRKEIAKEFACAGCHLNVEELYCRVKPKRISLATLYRTIDLFCQLDILKEMRINGLSYYELKIFSGKPLHIHFRCTECGIIQDINHMDTILKYLDINKMIELDSEVEIYDADITLIGLCSKCKHDFQKKSVVIQL